MVLIGGPVHGQAMLLAGEDRGRQTVVFVPPPEWTFDPSVEAPGHVYHPAPVPLLGRTVLLYRYEKTPERTRHVPHAVLSPTGLSVYDGGWGAGRPEPTGPAGLLLISRDAPACWREVEDPSAPVALRAGEEDPGALVRKLVLCDRWVRVLVPATERYAQRLSERRWFDAACAAALLTDPARRAWEAAK